MKIALVYDRINKIGGAEKILLALHQIWPQAPLYTAVYNPKTAPWAKDFKIKTSFLQKLPLAKTNHELLSLLTPLAFESFDFSSFNIVISITSAEAKAVITKPQTFHLCYCLTPTRYLWSHYNQYLSSPDLGLLSGLGKKIFKLTTKYQKKLDQVLANRPDDYLSISKTIQKRIKKYYQRTSQVLYPPINTDQFKFKPSQDYFLLVSRLVSYKNIDLAIKAFNKLNQNLVIVGTGRLEKTLKKLAGPTIKFKGQVSQAELVSLYARSKALIMPQEEDFGIVSLEAQASGKPVIALNKGGAQETVIHKKTGLLFEKPTVDSLSSVVKQFKSRSWDHHTIQKQAQKFDTKIFKNKFKKLLEAEWQKRLR